MTEPENIMFVTKAFLCHSSSDKEIVLKVKKALDQRGIFTWLDIFQIGFGESIRREIEEGIASSNFLILFMSKAALKSEWVNREIDAAYMREVESKDTVIIPVLLDDCEIPTSLKPKRYVDFRENYEKGLTDLINAVVFSRKSIFQALEGKWIGKTGILYLSSVGKFVIGKYDWQDRKSGNIIGQIEKNRIKFDWSWDHSEEYGSGVFELDETLQKLSGGWWFGRELDPDMAIRKLTKRKHFNQWEFTKSGSATDGKLNTAAMLVEQAIERDSIHWGYRGDPIIRDRALRYMKGVSEDPNSLSAFEEISKLTKKKTGTQQKKK
jgi:hypothetical protein